MGHVIAKKYKPATIKLLASLTPDVLDSFIAGYLDLYGCKCAEMMGKHHADTMCHAYVQLLIKHGREPVIHTEVIPTMKSMVGVICDDEAWAGLIERRITDWMTASINADAIELLHKAYFKDKRSSSLQTLCRQLVVYVCLCSGMKGAV